MSRLSYLCNDRKGGIYYYTVNEDNNVVDHGVVVSVDKYQGDKLEAVNKLQSAETVDALHIFGERFDLLDGDLAPEWNGKHDWERFDRADVIFITLGFDGFDLDRQLRDHGVNIPVATAGSSIEDIHGERVYNTKSWERYWKQNKAIGRRVYIVGDKKDELDQMKKVARYVIYNKGRAFLVDMASLLPTDSTPIKIDWLKVAGNNARNVFLPLLDAVSEEYKGDDDDRLREAIRDAKESNDDQEDWTQDVDLPPRLKVAARALADKFRKPIRPVAAMALVVFLSRQGHERARVKVGGRCIYPYTGLIEVGTSGLGKSPVMKAIISPLLDLNKREAERARERQKNLDPLKKARKSASDQLAKAELATRAAKSQVDKERAEKAEKLAREIWNEIDRDYQRANAPGHKFIIKYASAGGVKLDLAENAAAARALGVVNDGALIWLDEGARLLGVTQGEGYGLDVFATLSEVLDVTTNGGTTVKGDGAADKYDADLEIGAAILVGIQMKSLRADKIDAIQGQGFLNRVLWGYAPYPWKETSLDEIEAALNPWFDLFKVELPPNEYRLDDEADQIYREWRAGELQELKNDAYRRGYEDKVGFLSKLDEIVIRVALGFHLEQEATKIDEGLATLPRLLIGASTMRMATAFCKAMIEERDKTLRQIGLARERNKRRLSMDAKKVYDYLVAHGGWASITEIKDKISAYKKARRRGDIDEELENAGLMIIGNDERNNKRHAVIIDVEDAKTKRAA